MATPAEDWLRSYRIAEKELLRTIDQKGHTYTEVDDVLIRTRGAFENAAFLDFDLVASQKLETQLWEAHSTINTLYRKRLAKFQDEEGKKRPVEKRKLEKHYLDFIKSSMRFYRSYIHRLASHFKGIPQLSSIATRFNLDTTTLDLPVTPSQHTRELILDSCHATLVHLGDLSRYRESELRNKERNWGPAIGYYDLASSVMPSSGLPHNQLAVIALKDGHHARALYHLYRAQTVVNPHPSAKGNLDLEFKKILRLQLKNELFPRGGSNTAERRVEAWFALLHARCAQGEEWTEHEPMENEVLSQLVVLLKERSLEGLLQRLCLSNIAAEYLAAQLAKENPGDQRLIVAFQFYQRINVKTFFNLIQILLPEVSMEDDSDRAQSSKDPADRLTSTARRILPTLRNYSTWLRSNAILLVVQGKDQVLGIHIREFWRAYATMLTLLAGAFKVRDLPLIEYLLDEDVDMVGFVPLTKAADERFFDEGDNLKPFAGDNGLLKELPNQEMLFRVRGLLVDGLSLLSHSGDSDISVPIELVEGGRFFYLEEGLPKESQASPPSRPGHVHTHSSASINRDDIERDKLARQAANNAQTRRDDDGSTAASTSNNTMKDMVDKLVSSEASDQAIFPGLREAESEVATPTDSTLPSIRPFDQTATPRALTARDLVQSMHGTSRTAGPLPMGREETIRPLSSSIWTVMRGESPRLRPGTAHAPTPVSGTAPPLPLSDSSQMPPLHPTSSYFRDDLHRQHYQVHMRSSSTGTPSSSMTTMPTSRQQLDLVSDHHQQQYGNRPISRGSSSSPWMPSTASPYALGGFPNPLGGGHHLMDGGATDVPRPSPVKAQFGAIGQTPPSG